MLFTEPVENHKLTFQELYKRGMIKEKDAERIASEYQGIIVMGYFTNDLSNLEESLSAFYKRYF